jgi:release factor glutamine methyltransferase
MSRTVGAILHDANRRLGEAGISEARLDARLFACHVFDMDAAAILGHPERELTAAQEQAFDTLVARRERHEPVALILGTREFWSLPFRVTADTLIPRPDSETLVEAVLERVADRDAGLSLLDLGTGTGCLLLALLSELPKARGLGVDANAGAIEVARGNAQSLHLADRARFQIGDWARGLTGPFDVIISNPPYIPAKDIEHLAPDVAAFEPRAALCGGADGLDSYRVIVPELVRLMGSRGTAYLEIGAGQSQTVATFVHENGLQALEIKRDLAGIPRCVVAAPESP